MSRQWTKMLGAMLLFPILAVSQTSKPLTEEIPSSKEIFLSAITWSEDKGLTAAQTYTEQLSDNVSEAAEKANNEYIKEVGPRSTLLQGEYEIPPEYWNDTLKRIKPIRVYNHKYNIVIALTIQDGCEEGVYIFELSSFMPMPEDTHIVDGFRFYYPWKGKMINYRRDTRF